MSHFFRKNWICAKFGLNGLVFVFLNANTKLQPSVSPSNLISFWTEIALAGLVSGSERASLAKALLVR